MLDTFDTPQATYADIQVFNANSPTAGAGWSTWIKRRGASMCQILVWGGGGGGGNGAIGANSTAAGGGGGGSGGQTSVMIPAALLPDFLHVSVSVYPDTIANNCVAFANQGNPGSSATGATAGTGANATSAATIAQMPLGGLGQVQQLVGQAGIAGGIAVAGAALTLPVTGLLVTGGTGGGGLPAAGVVGTNGGLFTVAGLFLPQHSGGLGATAATTPAGNGSHGISGVRNLAYDYGGTGGGSTHGTATGAGLVASFGGKGAIGSGGGGGGGALTGSTGGGGGRGGDGQVIIITW
jgi:hypothetical protein